MDAGTDLWIWSIEKFWKGLVLLIDRKAVLNPPVRDKAVKRCGASLTGGFKTAYKGKRGLSYPHKSEKQKTARVILENMLNYRK